MPKKRRVARTTEHEPDFTLRSANNDDVEVRVSDHAWRKLLSGIVLSGLLSSSEYLGGSDEEYIQHAEQLTDKLIG